MSYLVLNKSKVAKYQFILQEQRVKEIPAKSSVVFWFSSAFKNLYDSDDWEFTVNTPGVGTDVKLNGSEEESGSITALFGFITK